MTTNTKVQEAYAEMESAMREQIASELIRDSAQEAVNSANSKLHHATQALVDKRSAFDDIQARWLQVLRRG